jgi:hypothetical protein
MCIAKYAKSLIVRAIQIEILGIATSIKNDYSTSGGDVDDPGGTTGANFPLFIQTRERNYKFPESWAWNFW